ncbi:hypothetical protein [Pedobacter antarcticus]|uniref:hypothetical protein n=1 Tax=Pedobacter antarcticus TaxID=34086 RepID=UPI002930722D|nr:hypothetical protein [Pedobacter antarcticus]
MDRQEGRNKIENLRLKWQMLVFADRFCISLLFALPLSAVFIHFFGLGNWVLLPFVVLSFISCSLFKPFWKISTHDVARFLNISHPELEESSGLLLQETSQLNTLQLFQQQKVAETLSGIKVQILSGNTIIRLSAYLLTGVLLFISIPYLKSGNVSDLPGTAEQNSHGIARGQGLPPQLNRIQVQIIPPAYTGVSSRKQNQLSIKAENGAILRWEMQTSIPVKHFKFIFNDKEKINLQSENGEGKSWTLSRKMVKPGFYQIEMDGKKSDLYQVELIADRPVVIQITQPKPHTTIDFGEAKKVNMKVSLDDDYGIQNAYISATLASGKGEGVSFTEKKLVFNTSFNAQKSMKLQKELDLNALGMKPGDELYFFVAATDNYGQASRSDVYFVSIADTTELMSLAGMTSGVNLVPEYFRSQRQIIMDTEKLLSEQSKITVQQFKTRSNDLGTDQKLLRMRYGKFLGEESETEIGGGHDHDEEGHDHEEGHSHGKEPEKTAAFGDVQAIMDSYAHKHDIAEDATFFEPEVKSRLKAVLTEMWSSELKLRTYQPQEALPFAYKALRLLKDLQQKSRAFVAKTTVKVSQLKEEKRFSGELDKIGQPVMEQKKVKADQRDEVLKKGLSYLETYKTASKIDAGATANLWEMEKYLVVSAVDHPDTYLPALRAIRELRSGTSVKQPLIDRIQKAVRKMLEQEVTVPQAGSDLPSSDLYQQYFNQLKKDLR